MASFISAITAAPLLRASSRRLYLQESLIELVQFLISIMTRKGNIDESLRTSVSKKKSRENEVMEREFALLLKEYAKFTTKYAKIIPNLPILTSEVDAQMGSIMLQELYENEPRILTGNFFKFANLRRDIAGLSKRALKFYDRLQHEASVPYEGKRIGSMPIRFQIDKLLIHEDSEIYEELDTNYGSDNDLPIFNKYVEAVLNYLSSRTGNRVGVTGPAGVGKTTVLRKLRDRLMDTKLLSNADQESRLDNIIWIPEQRTVEQMQAEIMLQLQIGHEKTNSELINAYIISTFLQKKKYVFLMDHVSESIDLNSLGITESHREGNVVLASTHRKTVRRMTQYDVEIQRLGSEDAIKLFEIIHGKIDKRFKRIADEIIECCVGLPHPIKFAAIFLKYKKHDSLWMDEKRILLYNTWSTELVPESGISYLYMRSYYDMKPTSQKCFLFTALFPDQYIIYKDYLIECWIAEGIIQEYGVQKLRRARDLGQAIVDEFTDRFLLDCCEDRKYVKMPSICRRVALQLQYDGQGKSLVWVPSEHENPTKETWEAVARMSLISCTSELPERPKCPNMVTLLLRSKPDLKNLADSFFRDMESLRILDLYHTEIWELPTSIDMLFNLKSLCLNGCKYLEMLPFGAAQLKKLEFLDICGTSIRSLPRVIEYMVELTCLRASFSSRGDEKDVEMIPPGIIYQLRKLEELSISTDNFSPSMELAESLAMELASLEYLTTLQFQFPYVSSFEIFVTHSKSLNNDKTSWGSNTFRSFKIFVGYKDSHHSYKSDLSKQLVERRLRVNGEFSSASTKLLKQTCVFELLGDKSVETLSQHNLSSVKVCVVGSCNGLRNIVDEDELDPIEDILEENSNGVFQDLERLYLYDLQLLECVWERTYSPQTLENLTVLTLKGCPKLTRLLDSELCCALPRLKTLKIESCPRISQIVEGPNESKNSTQADLFGILNSVKTLVLVDLPSLESICYGAATLNWNSLNFMVVIGCNNLRNLSFSKTSASRLTSITCEKSWWDQLPLADAVKQHLLPFCRFEKELVKPGELETDADVLHLLREIFVASNRRKESETDYRNSLRKIFKKVADPSWQTKVDVDHNLHTLTSEKFLVREHVIENLLAKCLKPGKKAIQLSAIPIFGVSGIGKTALARHVFEYKLVQKHFELRVWVEVDGQEFKLHHAGHEILKSTLGMSCSIDDLYELDEMVRDTLQWRRCLIVLDGVEFMEEDLWHHMNKHWFDLVDLGSVVLITTPSQSVANLISSEPFEVKQLLPHEGWFLFGYLASKSLDMVRNMSRNLEALCRYIPLLLKLVGSMMRFDDDLDDLLSIENFSDVVSPYYFDASVAILLCVWALPQQLRQCLAFCTLLPKGYALERQKIINMWIARDLIKPSPQNNLHEIGDLYFHHLHCRSFFTGVIRNEYGDITEFRIPGLIHTVMQDVASIVLDGKLGVVGSLSEDADQLSLQTQGEPEDVTVLILSCTLHFGGSRLDHSLHDFQELQSLDLSCSGIRNLSESVCELRDLRHLNLSYTLIETLPDSITNLSRLHSLDLSWCYNFKVLPKRIRYLKYMSHLDLFQCESLCHLPSGVGYLRSLTSMTLFVLGKGDDSARLGELCLLNQLQGRLDIRKLENIKETSEAREAALDLKKLHHLGLCWSKNVDDCLEVLESLKPNRQLKVLDIAGYMGVRFPRWISFMTSLEKISISNCGCEKLPSLGELPLLKELQLKVMANIEHIGQEFYGYGVTDVFPSLEQLVLFDMPRLFEWSDADFFPLRACRSLKNLTIEGCPRLRHVPTFTNPLDLTVCDCGDEIFASLLRYGSVSSLLIKDTKIKYMEFSRNFRSRTLKKLILFNCIFPVLYLGFGDQFDGVEHLSILHCSQVRIIHLLPIQKLHIVDCQNLSVVKFGQNTNLTELVIEDCPSLHYPVRIRDLQSLTKLIIKNIGSYGVDVHCLDKLQYLSISECPEMEKELEMKLPSLISHIPCVILGNHKVINKIVIDSDHSSLNPTSGKP